MSSFVPLINELARVLMQKNWQLITAESCTGGLIASSLTELPGSSKWFERGFVTYSNLAKQDMLAVPEELIVKYGAVSEEVAAAMATGALLHSKGQIALSVTGVAGPDGGSAAKPVGTVCFGWAAQGMAVKTIKKHCPGTRQEVRQAACQIALEGVLALFAQDLR